MSVRIHEPAREDRIEVADWFTSLPACEDQEGLDADTTSADDDDIFGIDFTEYDMVSIREALERSPYLHGHIVA